jgi:adenosine deaminase
MEEVRALNIPVALHLGECREETEEQQMRELTLIQPSRIGHGVFLCDKAKEYIYTRRLPIEMCLSSAVWAHMVDKAEDHPALVLLKEGYPVIVCTDDPLIFRTTHSQESELARRVLGYSLEQMNDLHQSALMYKF